ncbi:TIGR02530 family flagellar biosynthesis protein [Paenibacillus sp. JX-17]|uniref:TIGR02530 family flagellar biosynthesis protein n=1 Tax=Paenibacillus lacisoli TaxID=3064525 RepID=A0ABT9CBA2_9BACL|nr:TIGR02530 family flagellar biosynthesis protein [Paenibacillus sp. JX-17]MDO7905828.1 TIGR02530 family flagellar biosynthesis protein [Paenibacillus sp. JX-17]
MSNRITVGQLFPGRVTPADLKRTRSENAGKVQQSFDQMLQDQVVKVSNHAAKRLEQRGLELKDEHMAKIGSALDQAAAKGAKESLFLMNNMALIVNVPKRTIVTAMDGDSMQNNIFTQIDSAVIIS